MGLAINTPFRTFESLRKSICESLIKLAKACETINCESLQTLAKHCETKFMLNTYILHLRILAKRRFAKPSETLRKSWLFARIRNEH